jgi:hypothetical protein
MASGKREAAAPKTTPAVKRKKMGESMLQVERCGIAKGIASEEGTKELTAPEKQAAPSPKVVGKKSGKANKAEKKTEKEAPTCSDAPSASACDPDVKNENANKGAEPDESDADDGGSSQEKRLRQPSSKVVENKEMALEAAKRKSQKGKPRLSKQAKGDKRRLDSRAMKDCAVVEILQSLGMDAPNR